MVDGRAVCEGLAHLDLLAQTYHRAVVDAGALVGALVLGKVVAL